MKKLFIALLSMVILCAADVGADPNQRNSKVHWQFTTNLVFITHPNEVMNVGPRVDNYSNDLGQSLGVPLPTDMVKQNWACVREATTWYGGFKCSNGVVSMYSRVNCINNSSERSVMYIAHEPDDNMLAFVSECVR
jgi:hypothetical protein